MSLRRDRQYGHTQLSVVVKAMTEELQQLTDRVGGDWLVWPPTLNVAHSLVDVGDGDPVLRYVDDHDREL